MSKYFYLWLQATCHLRPLLLCIIAGSTVSPINNLNYNFRISRQIFGYSSERCKTWPRNKRILIFPPILVIFRPREVLPESLSHIKPPHVTGPSANQNAGLQCKINSASQWMVELFYIYFRCYKYKITVIYSGKFVVTQGNYTEYTGNFMGKSQEPC